MYEYVILAADSIKDKVIKYRRDFHKYPESAWTEFRTASLIARKLIDLGFEVKLGRDVIKESSRMDIPSYNVLEDNYIRAVNQGADKELLPFFRGGFTGVVGIIKNGEGPTTALRFDIDALEIQESNEENHLPFREGFSSLNNNVMHACGHDGHIAIGLCTAEILSKFKDNLKGTVKIIFQPAEEGVRGAKSMVDAKVLDGVNYLISGHIGLKADKSGQIVCGTKGFLATSKIIANFKGKASHAGAAPEKGDNALLSAACAVLNLHSIPRNSKGATRINVGKLISGTASNIIPENAYMEIETRGETNDLNDYMKNYAERILHSAAQMHDTKLNIEYGGQAESAESSDDLMKTVKKSALKIYNPNLIIDKKINFGASEDISYMMNKVQSNGGQAAYLMFGSNLKSPNHSSNFDFNEADLINAVKLYSILVLDINHK